MQWAADLWKWHRPENTNCFRNESDNFMVERPIMAYYGKLACVVLSVPYFSSWQRDQQLCWTRRFWKPLIAPKVCDAFSHQMFFGATVSSIQSQLGQGLPQLQCHLGGEVVEEREREGRLGRGRHSWKSQMSLSRRRARCVTRTWGKTTASATHTLRCYFL